MDDQFLHDARRAPRPAFAEALSARLRRLEDADEAPARFRWTPAFAGALAAGFVIALIAFPAVRDKAQAFLDLFRVRNFAAVSVDPERLKMLEDGSLDLKGLLSDNVETLDEPGPMQTFDTPAAAGTAVGFAVRVPGELPRGMTLQTIETRGAGAARFTVNGKRLDDILQTLDIRNVPVPVGLDGATMEVRMPPSVTLRFASERRQATLVQSNSPEMTLPPGVDMAQVGEIGLRIAGLEAAEASRFARSIDWKSTFLVPVPANAGTFTEVDVRGNKALLVTAKEGHKGGPGGLLTWAEGGKVYALMGNVQDAELVTMANTLK